MVTVSPTRKYVLALARDERIYLVLFNLPERYPNTSIHAMTAYVDASSNFRDVVFCFTFEQYRDLRNSKEQPFAAVERKKKAYELPQAKVSETRTYVLGVEDVFGTGELYFAEVVLPMDVPNNGAVAKSYYLYNLAGENIYIHSVETKEAFVKLLDAGPLR